jgi:hypothetical protein
MKKPTVRIDEEQRIILRSLQDLLRMLGDANDAEDHDFLDVAEQERREACASIREFMAQNSFIIGLLPTLQEELGSRHILTFGWAELYSYIEEILRLP